MVSATWRLWSYAHGWQPMSHVAMSHVEDFGHFFAPTVQLICPLIGFALFWITSRHKVGLNLWKPMAIALLLTRVPGYASPSVEVARTILIVLSMAWSVGAIRISMPHTSATESPATA